MTTKVTRRHRELEVEGLPESCLADPRGDGRFLQNFLTFLSRVTSTTISTSVARTTFSLTARVTFKGCTPTDVSTIFPTSCPAGQGLVTIGNVGIVPSIAIGK